MIRLATHVALPILALALAAEAGSQVALPLKYTGKPTQTAITAADAMTRLYIFADDSMLGRGAGEPGGMKGTAYIEREVRRLGLIPAGDNGTFFQAVPLYKRRFDISSKLSADKTALIGDSDYVPLHPGGTPRSLDGAQVIFAGSPYRSEAMISSERAKGKVVFVIGSAEEMARRYPGAVAFIVVTPDPSLAQVIRFVGNTPILMRSSEDSLSTPLTLVVPISSAAKFLGVSLGDARAGTLGRTLHGDVRYIDTDAPARNVVAILPGSDPRLRREYVAIGAHNDHLGIRTEGPVDTDSLRAFNAIAARLYIARTGQLPLFPGEGITSTERTRIRISLDSLHRIRPARLDSIYNGADDDGSGSIGALEIAEKFVGAATKPKRSLLFIWHTGEELDLYGSRWFTDHPTVPRDSIVAELNVDMIGRGEASDTPVGGPGHLEVIGSRRLSSELGDIIESVNKTYAAPLRLDYSYDAPGHPEQYYCRSDHYEYARYGIPVAFMSTGGHIDYHQVTDEPQYINYAHLSKVASFVADVAERVANLDHRLVVDKAKPDPHATCVQ